MRTKIWAIALVILCTALTSSGQILLKMGVKTIKLNLSLFGNYSLILGVFFYFTAGIILLFALRGGDLSVLYPLIATSYVWVALLSVMFFGEMVDGLRWFGIGAIILGVTAIGIGGNYN